MSTLARAIEALQKIANRERVVGMDEYEARAVLMALAGSTSPAPDEGRQIPKHTSGGSGKYDAYPPQPGAPPFWEQAPRTMVVCEVCGSKRCVTVGGENECIGLDPSRPFVVEPSAPPTESSRAGEEGDAGFRYRRAPHTPWRYEPDVRLLATIESIQPDSGGQIEMLYRRAAAPQDALSDYARGWRDAMHQSHPPESEGAKS